MVTEQSIIAASGKVIPTQIDSVCVHGDTPGAVEIAKAVRSALEQDSVIISPFISRP
jgi:UPF0271 protein